MMKSLSILIPVFFMATLAAAQWNQVSPYPTIGNLYGSAFFVDENEGWVYKSGLFHTSDGGASWEKQLSDCTQEPLECLFFVNADEGWGAGLGTIMHTSDGGGSWTVQFSGQDVVFESLHFIDEMHGWAVGYNFDGSTGWTWSELLETTDGGVNWNDVYIDRTDMQGAYHDIFFTDSSHGWLLATINNNGYLKRTTDGGTTWTSQSFFSYMDQVFFADTLHGWIINDSEIYHSSDGGATWVQQNAGQAEGLSEIHFSSPQKGMITGYDGLLLKTDNGGQNWQATFITSPEYPYDRLDYLCVPDSLNCWVVGSLGGIYHSNDAGDSWELQSRKITNSFINAIYFTDVENGWMVGNNGTAVGTADEGATWQTLGFGDGTLFDVTFTDADHGWIVGSAGTILHTVNGGSDWDYQASPTTGTLYDVCFVNNLRGWIGCDNGILLHTFDGGLTWTEQDCGIEDYSDIKSVCFTDENNGWIALYSIPCELLHTNDGGQTWISQYTDNSARFNSIFFTDSLNGWAAGNKVVHTGNGGLTWEVQLPLSVYQYYEVMFIDPNTGWIGPPLRYTLDGGLTWKSYTCLEGPSDLWSFYFLDELNGWGAWADAVFHTTTGGFVDLPERERITSIKHFCYPNPFPEKIEICFNVGRPEKTGIQILDMMGKQVYRLIYDSTEGENIISLDLNALSKGLYVYRIATKEKSVTGKIIKL